MQTLFKFMSEVEALVLENKALREENKALLARPLDNRRKLTELEVRDIRQAYRAGMSQVSLADNYGVNPATISRTVRGFYH